MDAGSILIWSTTGLVSLAGVAAIIDGIQRGRDKIKAANDLNGFGTDMQAMLDRCRIEVQNKEAVDSGTDADNNPDSL